MLLILFIFLIVPLINAEGNYTEAGNFETDFIRGNGIFNSQLDPNSVIISTAVLADPKKIPLIADLDNDGILEIIVLNGNNLVVFQNKSLSVSDTISLNAPSTERYSNMITFDIDGDLEPEIILVGEKREIIHILNFTSGQGLVVQNEINFSFNSHTGNEGSISPSGLITIGCESANRCLMAYADEQDTGIIGFGENTVLFASYFNSTTVANEITLDTSVTFSAHCPPKIRLMEKADYDEDGSVEFIFAYSEPNIATGDTGDDLTVYWVDILANNTPNEEISTTTSEVGEIIVASGGVEYLCDNANGASAFRFSGGSGTAIAGKFFTAPLVYNADFTSAGLETIIGVMTDNNEFIMIMYDETGAEIREFPFIQESEGQILSNMFQAEIFDDTSGDSDFCVFSQESTENRLALTCGSLIDTDGFGLLNSQTIEFRGDGLATFNVSHDFDEWNIITHSVEYDSSNANDEILTTFGILEADISGASCIFANCDLNLLFQNPKADGAVISSDIEQVGLEDLLVLSSTNLFYLDDGFVNQPAVISQFTTNPCIDSVWQQNTSVEITVTATDPENDLVQVSATLYADDSNEITQISANVSSGTSVPFSFTANKTIGAGTLRMTAVDAINNPTVDTIERSFSVATNGVEFGECVTTEDIALIVANVSATFELTAGAEANQGLTNFFNQSSNAFSLSPFIIAILLMLAWTITVITTSNGMEQGLITQNKMISILAGNLFIFLLSVIAGAIPFGVMLVIIIIGVIIIGIWVRSMFTSSRQGM